MIFYQKVFDFILKFLIYDFLFLLKVSVKIFFVNDFISYKKVLICIYEKILIFAKIMRKKVKKA